MMTALQSGVSGLRVHQTKMDVIAHNVANVNTNDFKSSTITFKESYSQRQVGSGVAIGSIEKTTTTGAMVQTGDTVETMSNTDLANEFTEMITTQRGFEANARTITMADLMLKELVNIKK